MSTIKTFGPVDEPVYQTDRNGQNSAELKSLEQVRAADAYLVLSLSHPGGRRFESGQLQASIKPFGRSIYSRHEAMRGRTLRAFVVCAVTAAWLVPLTLGGTVRPV